MEDRITISVPCDLRFRNIVAELIRQFCTRRELLGAQPEVCMHVHSAFIEAFNNLAHHGPGRQQRVQVNLERQNGQLVIELCDSGQSFDFAAVQDPDLAALPESGFGIFIIKRFMSKVEYSPGEDGGQNILRMVKDLHPEAGPAMAEPA